jgi:tetratricopeptide (TPR) repeat protein
MRYLLVAALLVAPTFVWPGAPPDAARQGAAPSELKPLLAEIDALHVRRDDPAQLKALREKVAEAEKLAPNEYEVLWRVARLNVWLADDPGLSGNEKSRLGKLAWDVGDRASAANPARVEGWYFAATGVGMYALGIGVITALRQGIEGKFKDRLSAAERIDPAFNDGAIQTAWGRFWYELPWPKYSPDKSRKALEAALKKNPANARAHVYLADLLAKEDHRAEATAELQRAVATVPGRYDAPEERRWQEIAKKKLTESARAGVRGSEGG